MVEIGVLGPLSVRVAGREVEIGSGRLRAVLAVLASEVGRSVSVERLAQAVWGEELPANVRNSTQTQIMRLRRLLGGSLIRTEGDGYRLDVEADHVDAVRFGRLLGEARSAITQAEQGRLLTEALALWRGRPFEGVGSQWLDDVEAERMVELYLSAREQQLDLELTAGRHGAAVAELRELTGRFPLREAFWSRLLKALRQCGRPAEALACYEAVRVLLADELGAVPGPELRRQYAELLDCDEEQQPVPQQLPAARGALVGRAQHLQALDEAVESTTVVLHGFGGIGKTALALQWAQQHKDLYPDGQLFIDLQGYGPGKLVDAGSALRSFLIGLGVPDQQIPYDAEARTSLLRTTLADRRCLLVLDNALDADHVRPLIPGPGSLALVTSRNELHGLAVREGAPRIALDVLTPEESIEFLREKTDEPDDRLLGELAELCGYIPLALSIAAVRSDGDVEAMTTELRERRLTALAIGDESGDLRAVFARSYQALDPYAARAFRLLGLHLGSEFSTSTAAWLLGTTPYDARAVLDSLADQHLLCRTRGKRFEFHQLVRAYAVELT
ncbi:BTAD domain-containing putative transcriptional regulator [Kribbella sp. DT2]|uniref:AfsR/SARP family transcriptional regulator n=1 Tax=Kribbella sp. DT2 TaxID=3393427 RepID=UPI003CE8AB6B